MDGEQPVVIMQRPPVWLRFGGGVFLLIVAVAVVLGTVASDSSAGHWSYVVAIGVATLLVAVATWWTASARVEMTVTDGQIQLAGPLWRRQLPLSDVAQV